MTANAYRKRIDCINNKYRNKGTWKEEIEEKADMLIELINMHYHGENYSDDELDATSDAMCELELDITFYCLQEVLGYKFDCEREVLHK